jgi:hypothetical protein
MATTTPNFGWSVPTSTDLVKDGATAIELLGDSIDASLVDLKGGTTGQVLSKASNADMDFTWVTDAAGDITGVTAGTGISGGGTSGTVTITNSMATAIDAKGDLVAGTGADAFARLAVGANNTVLTADSSTATGLKWATGGSGGMTLLSTTTLSGTSTTVSSIDQTYTNLFVVVSKYVSASGSVGANIQYNGVTSGYYGVNMADISTSNQRNTNGSAVDTGNANSAAFNNGNALLTFTIPNYANSGYHLVDFSHFYFTEGTSLPRSVLGTGGNTNTSAVTSISITSAVAFTGGTIQIYGVK